jgi:hypothetical protein
LSVKVVVEENSYLPKARADLRAQGRILAIEELVSQAGGGACLIPKASGTAGWLAAGGLGALGE